jgi:hypothetical protein
VLTFETQSLLTINEENNEELHLKELVNTFDNTTNFSIDHYTRVDQTPVQIDLLDCPIVPGPSGNPLTLNTPKINAIKSKNMIEMSSKFYPLNKVNKIKFEGKLGIKVEDSEVDNLVNPFLLDNIDGYTLIHDHLFTKMPSKENFKNVKLSKVEMKIMGDMYFDQIDTYGDQVNTTQVFTYLLYDEEKDVDLLSSNGLVINDPNIFYNDFHSGTIYLDGHITSNHPAITKINGNDLFIDAEEIVINGPVTVEQGKRLFLRSIGSIFIEEGLNFPDTEVSGEIIFENHNNLIGSSNPEYTDAQVQSFCNSSKYKANQVLNGQIDQGGSEPVNTELKINSEQDKGRNVSIYPNPTSDFFKIAFKSDPSSQYRFALSSITGRTLMDETVKGMSSGTYEVDLSRFESGLYILNIYEGNILIAREKVAKK